MFETISLKHPCIKMRQKICRRTLYITKYITHKYIASKFGLQHQHQRLAVVGRDCSRRCRQCLCPRAAGAEEGRWPRSVRAFNPRSRNISLERTLLLKLRTLPPRAAARSLHPGWKACAGLGLADAATEGSNDKQGALIVSHQQMLLL